MLSPQYSPIVGGYEQAAQRLSLGLVSRGHRVTVISERRDRTWARKEIDGNLQVKRLPCLYRQRFHMLSSIASFAFFLIMRGRNFHAWHVHQFGPHALVTIILGRFLRRPVVIKLTSHGPEGLKAAISRIPLSSLAKLLLRSANAVAAPSRETREEAIELGLPAQSIHLLGNGTDAGLFRPQSDCERNLLRTKLGISAAGVAIFVGRLSPEKNLTGLLRAWKRALPHLQPGWKLSLLGQGPMHDELRALVVSEKISGEVILAGSRNNVAEWLGASDIFVLPSDYEGLSNALLEAMASGLAVISTRVSGTFETLEETGAGVLVDPGREDQLAEAIVLLANTPDLRKQLGQRARKIIESRFSAGYIAYKYEQLYFGLCRH